MELSETITTYRLHNQGVPNKITYNKNVPPKDTLIARLREIKHVVAAVTSDAVTQAVASQQGRIIAMSDPRKYAKADGYWLQFVHIEREGFIGLSESQQAPISYLIRFKTISKSVINFK